MNAFSSQSFIKCIHCHLQIQDTFSLSFSMWAHVSECKISKTRFLDWINQKELGLFFLALWSFAYFCWKVKIMVKAYKGKSTVTNWNFACIRVCLCTLPEHWEETRRGPMCGDVLCHFLFYCLTVCLLEESLRFTGWSFTQLYFYITLYTHYIQIFFLNTWIALKTPLSFKTSWFCLSIWDLLSLASVSFASWLLLLRLLLSL